MDKKELFRAIDACEDRFIREAAEDIQKRKSSIIRRFFFVNSSENAEKDMRKLSGVRVAAAIVICVIVLSIGVQTAARVSTVFRDWIEQTFQIKSSSDNQKGKNGRSNEEETGRVRRRNNKADEGKDSVLQIEKVPMKDRSEKISEETFQKEVSEKISQELQDAVSQKERPKETDEEISQKETAGKSENENEIRSAETENKCQGCEPGTDTRWNRATARYIHFQPVQDEKIEDAIRIQPSDLKILWQKGLRQGSNSFLMHGYYQHQHLMIGKSKEGGYILGIPGFYGEKNMAEMFGFPEFRRAKAERTSEIKEQTFGYWCKNLI